MEDQRVTGGFPTDPDEIDALIGGVSGPTLDSIAEHSRWVEWRTEDGRKIPYQPNGRKAQSNNPDTWRARNALSGTVGIVLGSHDGLTIGGLDLDSCIDPATGQLEEQAAKVIERFGSYAEVSPSGTGVKVFFQYRPEDAAALTDKARVAFNRGEHCEMALDLTGRYYAVTGERLDGSTAELKPVDAATLTWFVREAGPAFKAGGASEKRDRSAEAFVIAKDIHRLSGTREEFEAELAKDPDLAEWAKDARQVDRAWQNSECDGFDELDAATADAEPTPLRFLSPAECEDSPSRGYLVKGLLAPGDVGCIYGAPGAGKSLLSPHIGYCVALGGRAFGMRTRPGAVLYVAPEDPHGLRGRITALRAMNGDTSDFSLVEGVSNLLEPNSADLKALRIAVAERRPALIFLDTLAAAFPGLEENTAEDMSRVVSIARSLTRHGAAVVLIHHDTKAQSPTPRGHSVLNGALDVALQLFPRDQDGIVRGTLSKNRNGPCDLDIAFRIGLLDRGEDEDGDPIRLPYVDELTGPAPKRDKLPARAQAALAVLSELKRDSATVTEVEWRAACIEGRKVSPSDNADSRAKAFNRALSDLTRCGIVDVRNGLVVTQAELEPDPFDEVAL